MKETRGRIAMAATRSTSRRALLRWAGTGVVAAAATTAPGVAGATTRAAQSATTITWATWGGAAQSALYVQAIEKFHGQQATIRVENINSPELTDHTQKILTTAAGGNPSDLIMMPGELIASYAEQGIFAPVEELASGDASFAEDAYFPNTLDAMRYDGQLWGLPKDFNVHALYYNRQALDEAGVAYPTNEWTWDDLLTAAQALTQRDGDRVVRYGWTDSGPNPWRWIWQNGGEVFDRVQDPTALRITEPAALEAMRYYFDLSTVHEVAPSAAELEQAGGRQELFAAGRVAMLYDHRGATVPFAQIQDFEWDIAELAYREQRADGLAFAGYCVSAGSEQQAAAWEFAKWLTGPEGVPVFIGAGNALPALRALAADPSLGVQQPFLAAVEYARPFVQTPHWAEISPIISRELELVATGDKAAEAAATAIKTEVDPILQG